MGTFIGFLVGVAISFAAYLNTKHGFLGYLCGELSASSALLLPCGKEGKRQGRERGAGMPPSLLLGWRAEELRLVMSTWSIRMQTACCGILGKRRKAPLMGTEPRWSNLGCASPCG